MQKSAHTDCFREKSGIGAVPVGGADRDRSRGSHNIYICAAATIGALSLFVVLFMKDIKQPWMAAEWPKPSIMASTELFRVADSRTISELGGFLSRAEKLTIFDGFDQMARS